jgi:hypothetical protein
MENLHTMRNLRFFIILVAIFSLVSISPLLSRAQPTTSINIVNNSTRTIRHVYLSHVDADDWGGDQLSSGLASGQSATVSNFACDQQQIKVIGEDQDGCFLTSVVACGESATWTITNETAADCGQ